MASVSRSNHFNLVIKNGLIITASDMFIADLGIQGEFIRDIGHNLKGDRVIDAGDKLVLPGAIDPHVHLQMPVGETVSSDDWESGTVAAAFGGTTTVIDFVEPAFDQPLLEALEARLSMAEGHAVVDFGLHMTLIQDDPETLKQIQALTDHGVCSFKTYTTYEGFRLSDDEFLHVMQAVSEAGGLLLVHSENDAIVSFHQQRLIAEGKTSPVYHAESRPSIAEIEAASRMIALAEVTKVSLYIVHVTTAGAAQAIALARTSGQDVHGETCPQYLLLTDKVYDKPGFEGAKFVCQPPLRKLSDIQALWRHLAAGKLETVGTDHCPFFYIGQKDLGRRVFTAIPGGLPGIETRLALLYTFGVHQKELSLNRWVEVCSTAPAKIFGLYPQKGTLMPGADADVVIFDPKKEVTLSVDLLHERVDYTPYEGMHLMGYPEITLLRGQILVEDGRFVGPAGRGRYVKRVRTR